MTGRKQRLLIKHDTQQYDWMSMLEACFFAYRYNREVLCVIDGFNIRVRKNMSISHLMFTLNHAREARERRLARNSAKPKN